MTFKDYLKIQEITKNFFYGQFFISKGKDYGKFRNILSANGKLLLNPTDGYQIITSAPINSIPGGLRHGFFYSFSLRFTKGDFQDKVDYSCSIDKEINAIKSLGYNPFKGIIEDRYKRLNSPDANKIISNLLREIGKGMYSSKKRMIFELLQNADDVPASKDVKFYIETHNDYMLIAHTGLPFNEDDVRSITSAAESTKQKKQRKTGFKGIGFKSVFTDSSKVIIKSGGFLFEFNKEHIGFNSFDKFYFDRPRYRRYPDLLLEDKKAFTDSKISFQGIRDIPWQLLPIWNNRIPESLRDSNFTNNNNVGIALKFGVSKVKEYLDEIVNLAMSGRFMLFLRNTTFFRCAAKDISVIKENNNRTGRTRILINCERTKKEYIYKVKTFNDIAVTDESFAEYNIGLKKGIDTVETGEQIPYFKDGAENRIDTIPPKIAAFEQTTISFAAPIFDRIIQNEPTFKNGRNFSYFFTYLPMNEHRIKFPFLVNADFVPSSNREEIQGDNPWNEYIFANIGYKVVKWVSELASENNPKYLTLLLPQYLSEEDTDIHLLTKKFNEYYQKGLEEIPFVLNDESAIVQKETIILDESGCAKILGNQFCYDLFDTTKRLPHPSIEPTILHEKLFTIEKITNEALLEKFLTPEGQEILEETIAKLNKEAYRDFLGWLNKFLRDVSKDNLVKPFINSLSFLRFSENQSVIHYNWNELKEKENLILINSTLNPLFSSLKKIALNPSLLNISNYRKIVFLLDMADTYLEKDAILVKKIAAKLTENPLEPNDKIKLLKFFENLQVTKNTIREIPLFKNKDGSILPLKSLISNKATYYSKWLNIYQIDTSEEAIFNDYINYLCQSNEVYSNFITNQNTLSSLLESVNDQNRITFYEFVHGAYKESQDKSITLVNLPIIYVNKEDGYKKLHNLYFTPELIEKKDFYLDIKAAIEILSTLELPDISVLPFLIAYGPKGDKKLVTEHFRQQRHILTSKQARALLFFLTRLGYRDNLLEYGYFQNEGENLVFVKNSSIKNFSLQQENIHNLVSSIFTPDISNLVPLPYALKDIPSLNILGLVQKDGIDKKVLEELPANLAYTNYAIHLASEKRKKWLTRLPSLPLSSTKKYTLEDSEFQVLSMLSEFVNTDANLVNNFRSIITIDSQKLADIAVKEAVTIDYGGNKYFFSLSNLLPVFAGKSNLIEQVVKNLTGIGQLDKLFDITTKEDISSEIIEKYPTLVNVEQYVYLQILKLKSSNLSTNSLNFSDIHTQKVLDFCYKESVKYDGFYFPLKQFTNKLSNWIPSTHLYPSNLSISSEKMPDWIQEWLAKENQEERKKQINFLKTLELNGKDSPIGTIRNFFLTGEGDNIEQKIVLCGEQKKGWLSRTAEWISSSGVKIEWTDKKRITYLTILNRLPFNVEYEIPIIFQNSEKQKIYDNLRIFKVNLIIYNEEELSNIEEKYQTQVEQYIFDNGGFFLPKELPSIWKPQDKLTPIEIKEVKDEKILALAPLLNDKKYNSWSFKENYPLKVLSENIPISIRFNEFELERKSGLKYEKIDDIIYFNEKEITWYEVIKKFAPVEELISLFSSSFDEIDKKDKEIETLSQAKSALERELEVLKAKLKANGINLDNETESQSTPDTTTQPYSSGNNGTFPATYINEDELNEHSGLRYNHIDKGNQVRISEETRERVKRYLQDRGYTVPSQFGMNSIVNGVISPDGIEIPLVAKSAKTGKLAIAPVEWLQLMKPNARLYLRTPTNLITSVSFEDLLSENNQFQIEFDIAHFSQEAMHSIAHVFRYTKNTKFLVYCSEISYSSMEKGFKSKDGEAGTMDLGI